MMKRINNRSIEQYSEYPKEKYIKTSMSYNELREYIDNICYKLNHILTSNMIPKEYRHIELNNFLIITYNRILRILVKDIDVEDIDSDVDIIDLPFIKIIEKIRNTLSYDIHKSLSNIIFIMQVLILG